MNKATNSPAKQQGTILAYVALARLDHSTKHIFVVPGAVFAYLLRGVHTNSLGLPWHWV